MIFESESDFPDPLTDICLYSLFEKLTLIDVPIAKPSHKDQIVCLEKR